jgi:PAS domain S-box-containing protein
MLYDDYGRPADYVFLNVNTAFEHITGLTNVVGQRATDVLPGIKDAHPELFEIYGEVAMTGRAKRFEFYMEPLKSWFDVSAHSPERDYFVTVVENITERKLLEKELTESEEKFAKAFNCAPALMTLSKADDGTILDVNLKFCEVSGFSRAECIGRTSIDVGWIFPEDRIRLIEELQAHGSVRGMDLKVQTKDKKEIELIYSGELMQTASHELLLSTALDVTERNRAEKSQKLLSTAIEQAWESVVITDSTGTIQYVNPAAAVASGYCPDELIGKGVAIFNSGKQDNNFYKELWETINAGNVWSGRFINKKKDGTIYHEDATISPVYDKSGNLTNFVSVKRDMTKQVELQQQYLQAQKMEAIGTLAGGFAHDFNNKLQVISGCAELILYNKDLPEAVVSDIGIIKQTLESSAELIKGMMVFSRKNPIELQPIELNKLITQNTSMLARSISKMIEIDLLLADDLWTIRAAPNQIDQILMNLAVNAADAMPNGGKLTIKSNNIVLDAGFCLPFPNNKPGRYALITISDTGAGMDKETVSHIFEPFFTTKDKDKGTGLGLAVVYGIVEGHGGMIICDSMPSVGATFKVYFPAIDEVSEEQHSKKKEPPRGSGETILLVDDEPDFLELAGRSLNRANYTVIGALNGKDAIELYEKHREEIRLVVLDLMMPEMGGKECLEALRRLDPNLKILMASGAVNSDIVEELKEIGATGLISKPFDTPQLLEKIRKIIDEE